MACSRSRASSPFSPATPRRTPCGVARVETGLQINGACRRDERVAPRGSTGIEKPPRPVEAATGGPGQHANLVLPTIRILRRDPLAHRSLGQPAERDELAAGQDGRRQWAELLCDEHHHRVGRRLLEILEQRVGSVLVHAIRVQNDIDAAVRLERPHVQVVTQRTNLVDSDHLAEGLEQVQIGMRA